MTYADYKLSDLIGRATFQSLEQLVVHDVTRSSIACARIVAWGTRLTLHKFNVWMTIVESGWNVWVWLVLAVSRKWVWLVVGVVGIYGCV